ncbi:cytochrome C oxidase subunit III [Flavobacterium akiainvivens]|uniref:Cytochrome C oxidase subunit III n=1 Tax=Flavobacterium akiainvivens TaxID=1202724 RepID=A0A0M9VHM4_9FLAO|nr:cbb3-type cytochrome c oxidase N-terminal domain-containing protein [Flavobacterium akiainvivens]KOS05719.1 cytochrome C oxidase subunit III [Flavobacterium akiainvivens]SFQ37251.1 cytochrome c oxidase cbb3-type subunit 3 [Flavobacterium akiainvivens]
MKKFIPVYVRVPLLFALVFMALEFFIDSGDRPAFIKYPLVSLFLGVFLFIQIAIEIVVMAIDNVTYSLLTDEQKAKLAEADAIDYKESAWFKKLKGFFIKTKPIEEEGEIIMNHNYDGIHELDNVLPPWWVKLFYVCILFAVVYLVRYHIAGDKNQVQEFEQEMAEAKIAVEEYKKTAKDLIDANSVTQLTEAADLASGKKIFQDNCVACHRADGGGQIGPNLTDEYWLLGGGIKNVFHTITEGGRDGKGMVAWKGTLKPSEIQLVASYVLSLKGSNPPEPKEPQGDIWKEEAKPAEPAK